VTRRLPHSRPSRRDATAGLVLGVQSVPSGLAVGLLAGLNPSAGLYGYLVGTAGGAVTTSSVFMAVQGTAAMAILIADVPGLSGNDAQRALVTLSLLTGGVRRRRSPRANRTMSRPARAASGRRRRHGHRTAPRTRIGRRRRRCRGAARTAVATPSMNATPSSCRSTCPRYQAAQRLERFEAS
jgi:hypothetical protein